MATAVTTKPCAEWRDIQEAAGGAGSCPNPNDYPGSNGATFLMPKFDECNKYYKCNIGSGADAELQSCPDDVMWLDFGLQVCGYTEDKVDALASCNACPRLTVTATVGGMLSPGQAVHALPGVEIKDGVDAIKQALRSKSGAGGRDLMWATLGGVFAV